MPFNINSLGGIVFVEVSYYFPFVFTQLVSALERMDPKLEECARIAGALLIRTTSLAHLAGALPGHLRYPHTNRRRLACR